jgi:transposase-like protein
MRMCLSTDSRSEGRLEQRWQRMAHNGRQEAVLLLLAGGRTVRDAAVESGVSERTIHRWRNETAFRERERQLRGEMLAQGLGRLVEAMTEAAGVLRALLASENEQVRLAAARSVIQLGNDLRKTVETEDAIEKISDRLEVIEEQQRGQLGTAW